MRLPELRRRLILAMGLPLAVSCGSPQSSPPGGGSGGGTGTSGGEIGNQVVRRAPGEACGPDQLLETVCGGTAGACGEWGDQLTTFGQTTLYITVANYIRNDPAFATFGLDDDRTAKYRKELADVYGVDGPLDGDCCYSSCTALTVASTAALDVPPGYHVEPRCVPAPGGGTTVPAEANPGCPAAVQLDGAMHPYHDSNDPSICCYATVALQYEEPYEHHNRGRPARVDGTVRLAGVERGGAWRDTAVTPDLAGLPAELRARLAAAWTDTARMEHASIASFANLALRLMAVGAPPELIAATHRAALDEIEHARIGFALAAAYGGAEVAPAPFADAARMSAAGGLDALALETFVDGCIGETVAAAEARWAATRATDPAIAGALATIADDETRHAELAWAIVAWCVRSAGPSLAAALERSLAEHAVARALPAAPAVELADHGVLSARDLAALRRDVLAAVIRPCLAALTAS